MLLWHQLKTDRWSALIDQPRQSRLLVPFGSKDWSPDRVSISEDTSGQLEFDCPVTHVVLDIAAKTPLRLNSDWYRLFNRPPMRELTSAKAQFNFIKEHMPGYCDVWGKFQQIFLTLYFDFVVSQIEAHKPELEQKLADMSSLFSYQDWLLSAFMPLPQPLLYVPDDPADYSYADEDMIRLPLMFWTGDQAIIVFFRGNETRSAKIINLQERLRENGFVILEIDQQKLTNCEVSVIREILPGEFHKFWQSEVLPSGPFKPEFGDPVF